LLEHGHLNMPSVDRVRLVGIDVDGTLIGSSGEVPDKVWQAVNAAQAAGIRLALCSGRPAFGKTVELARKLDPSGWHVFQNGASVVDLETRESASTPLPGDLVQRLIAYSRITGFALELYTDTEYVTESGGDWAREHAQLLGVPFRPRPFESLRGNVVRAQLLVSEADAPAVIAAMPAHLEVAKSSSPLMPHTRFIGLTVFGVSKGAALRTVASSYGVSLASTMYVGDSENDLSALRVVGFPVAMANADEAVLAASTHVVPHVDDGGLADALRLAVRR
jgi:Cof subfamily protein (haloacid dehalogenase superfamily)